MSEKTLNTRIINKNATLAEWSASSLILKKGEIALVAVSTASGGNYSVPTYLMKVGDGTSTFSSLNWLSAPASDVYTWAKKSALAYDDLPQTLRTEIDNLQSAVGSGGSVSESIAAAIQALDKSDTAVANQLVSAVSEANGIITVTRRALSASDIPTLAISKISGLQSALDEKATATDLTTLQSTVNTLSGTVSSNKSAIEASLASTKEDLEEADAAMAENISTLQTQVATLNSATTLCGVGTLAARPATADPGDIYIVSSGTNSGKEYIWSGSAWIELGDTTAEQTRLTALETNSATKSELAAEVSALNTSIGTTNSNVTSIGNRVGTIETWKTNATSTLTSHGSRLTTAESSITDHGTRLTAAESAISGNTASITGVSERVSAIESDYLKTADTFILNCGTC